VATLLMEQRGELSATQAKSVLQELLAAGGDPRDVAAQKGFEQLSSDSLATTVDELIGQYPDEWSRFRDGDEKLAQFFIGQVMKVTKGQANGKAVIAQLESCR
jgi:aspartyl-tRNA(Asn)/glutamyl-tRNA(Gln) amidotransferase subunit B